MLIVFCSSPMLFLNRLSYASPNSMRILQTSALPRYMTSLAGSDSLDLAVKLRLRYSRYQFSSTSRSTESLPVKSESVSIELSFAYLAPDISKQAAMMSMTPKHVLRRIFMNGWFEYFGST